MKWLSKKIENIKLNRGYIIKDDFFPQNLAEQLRKFALDGNIPYDRSYPNGYFSREFDNESTHSMPDYASNIIKEIAKDFVAPSLALLEERKYIRSWSFTYHSRCPGVLPHADPSFLNINVWVTPNNAIEDRSKNGLILYRKKAPKDWTWREYNQDRRKIKDFLKGVKYDRIPYKFNRAVIFPGNTFHATDSVHTNPGDENRRVNYTFLYA